MNVYVLNTHGKALMPTTPQRARLLLKEGKAKIVGRTPFTIRLVYGSSGYRQPVTLGVDAGYQTIGVSAVTTRTEVLSGELSLSANISERLKERAMYRRQRRARLCHRAPRFNNRSRPAGWLAPSIQHKFDTHLRIIEKIQSVLPVTRIVIEVASFDIQQIKNPTVSGKDYQQGEQHGYWNLREYILHRDNHTCQNPNCMNNAQAKVLQMHHLGYWKGDRSDRPENLITLCETCHTPKNHLPGNLLYGWQPTTGSFKPETFMTAVRWMLVNAIGCDYTYGYLTKTARLMFNLPKAHYHDACVIAGGTNQKRTKPVFFEQIRRNNRALQKFYDAQYLDTRTGKKASGQDLFSGRRTRNTKLMRENLHRYRGRKVSRGRVSYRRKRYAYQPNDIVRYNGQNYLVKGIQNYGDYIKLAGLPKPVKTSLVMPICWRKGICRKAEAWTTRGNTTHK